MAAKAKKKTRNESVRWPYGKRNYIVFLLAVIVIVIGYITLGQGSITLAPILLVVGYCVLIPIALLIRGKKEPGTPPEEQTGQPTGN